MYKYETRKLTFQLVPKTSWYDNLRSRLPNWPEISNIVRSTGVCRICGAHASDLDAHEVWEYDDDGPVQSLADIIPVCDSCHNAIHIGHANVVGRDMEAISQYMKVNRLSRSDAESDINEAFSVWERRSEHDWYIDEKQILNKVTELTGIDCDINKPINGRYYCFVAYKDKEKAKSMGAKWDNERKMWYFASLSQKEEYSAMVTRASSARQQSV